MSLEEALKENTRIMQELVAALNAASLHGKEAEKSVPVAKPTVAPKPVAKAPAPVAKPAPKPVAKAAPVADEGEVTYDQVKAAILALGNAEGKGRPVVTAVLEQFGVIKGPELQAEQYVEALEALTAALAE